LLGRPNDLDVGNPQCCGFKLSHDILAPKGGGGLLYSVAVHGNRCPGSWQMRQSKDAQVSIARRILAPAYSSAQEGAPGFGDFFL
jgi:hypothetical protein